MCEIELSVVGRSPMWVQKQLSSAVNTARCGLDTRLGPCVLHGVLRSNTSPPHYRPDGSFCSAHKLAFLRSSPKNRRAVLLSIFEAFVAPINLKKRYIQKKSHWSVHVYFKSLQQRTAVLFLCTLQRCCTHLQKTTELIITVTYC